MAAAMPRPVATALAAVGLAVALIVAVAAPAGADVGRPDTVGVVRDARYLLREANDAGPVTHRVAYGLPGDVPFVGDWDGDGRATPGVRRGTTFLLSDDLLDHGVDHAFAWGLPDDVPFVGDWDGDGVDTVGVRRGDVVYLADRHGSATGYRRFRWGYPSDVAFAGDWDGDGVDTLGVRRGDAVYLADRHGSDTGYRRFIWGHPDDVPLAGDWDGDGVDTVGVRRGDRFYLADDNRSTTDYLRFRWGFPDDVAVTGHWRSAFASSALPAGVRARMNGVSWRPGCPVGLDGLSYLRVRHHGFDGRVHDGELVVADGVAGAVLGVFRSLFHAGFPLQRVRLVDDYGADDDASMAANNTSAFNCRRVSGTSTWSQHSYGTAVDLNPVQNPWVRGGVVEPPSGAPYAARSPVRPGMIVRPGPVVDAFARIGWGWGGDWSSSKDYQHFSANGR